MKRKWIWIVLLILTFTLGIAFSAFAVSATSLTIKHNKKLPTPHDLITKGTILEKYRVEEGSIITLQYWIAWDKTDDIYRCYISLGLSSRCIQTEQETLTVEDVRN